MMPAWLFSKPAIFAGIVTSGLLVGGLWFRSHDARVRRDAVVNEKIKATEAALELQAVALQAAQDSLEAARLATDTVRVYVQNAAATYARARTGINTTAPQPPGTPAGSVVVPIAFVHAADSLARLVPELLATIRIERTASERRIAAGDSTIRLLEAQNAQLRIAIAAAKPGIAGKLKWAGYGGAAVALGLQLFKK